ncbi:hypothetical protein N9444_04185 [Gammaproteobacteria bacterium]|nr:hypothetical protein [Gammaproteobacteria bacterium]MDG2237423.1 hypothetical protein [Arenicellales bacterium]
MALRCSLVGDVEVLVDFKCFLTSTLGISSLTGLAFLPALPCSAIPRVLPGMV